ncbi:uncharacterized protein L3040_001677 [Drepanopeziza brunnea f. sp. 'multigermtubi']|uniref:uncharacterized protein n=1 Tax=Drepanopeziza brunnea f. sp. 'multigermtubi' TaxID=698441 RepID=UPI00238E997E|nr:hypothetical protein L3040_001677 [Drepanopeziza brunnea f. sp. 'multigermtubi']
MAEHPSAPRNTGRIRRRCPGPRPNKYNEAAPCGRDSIHQRTPRPHAEHAGPGARSHSRRHREPQARGLWDGPGGRRASRWTPVPSPSTGPGTRRSPWRMTRAATFRVVVEALATELGRWTNKEAENLVCDLQAFSSSLEDGFDGLRNLAEYGRCPDAERD